MARTKTTQVTTAAAATVQPVGTPLDVHQIIIQNATSTDGTAGFVVFNDATAELDDTGTLRYHMRFKSTANQTETITFDPPMRLINGLYCAAESTNTEVWLVWEG